MASPGWLLAPMLRRVPKADAVAGPRYRLGLCRPLASAVAFTMDAGPTGIRILPAREESVTGINTLMARSKGYWSWPVGYLEKALSLQAVDPTYLRNNYCFEMLGGM